MASTDSGSEPLRFRTGTGPEPPVQMRPRTGTSGSEPWPCLHVTSDFSHLHWFLDRAQLFLLCRHETPSLVMAPTVQLMDKVEGEHVETSDFFFDRIAEPVPVKPAKGRDDDSKLYDPGRLSSQPLAVSERFQLVSVAHSSSELCALIAFAQLIAPWWCERPWYLQTREPSSLPLVITLNFIKDRSNPPLSALLTESIGSGQTRPPTTTMDES